MNEVTGRIKSGRVAKVRRIDHGDHRQTEGTSVEVMNAGITSVGVTQAGEAVAPTPMEDMDEGMGVTSQGADTASTHANTSTRPRRLGNFPNCPLMPLMDTRQTRVCISCPNLPLLLPLPTLAPTSLAGTKCTNIHPSHLRLRCTHLSLNPFRNFRSRSIPLGITCLGNSSII